MDDLEGLAHYDSIMIKCGSDKLTRVYNKWREEFELVQIYYVRGSSIPSFISIWLQSARLHSLGGVWLSLLNFSSCPIECVETSCLRQGGGRGLHPSSMQRGRRPPAAEPRPRAEARETDTTDERVRKTALKTRVSLIHPPTNLTVTSVPYL